MAQYEIFTKPEKKAPPRSLADLVHHCTVCRRPCGLSADSGRTWQCREHVPADFFPSPRAAPAPSLPAPNQPEEWPEEAL